MSRIIDICMAQHAYDKWSKAKSDKLKESNVNEIITLHLYNIKKTM